MHAGALERYSRGMNPRKILGGAIVAVLAVFIGYNWTSANVQFFAISLKMPLGLLVLASAGLGSIATMLFQYVAHKRKVRAAVTKQLE